MRIETLFESLYKDDFEVLSTSLFDQNEAVAHGSFVLQDEMNDVEYTVDLFIDKKTFKYEIEQIVVADGGREHDGDRSEIDVINMYLSNNSMYVLGKILKDE